MGDQLDQLDQLDQMDQLLALGTSVVMNMRRSTDHLKIMQKKFPKDIANIIVQYMASMRFIIEQIGHTYWVRIMPIITYQWFYTHEIVFTTIHDQYVVMSTTSSVVRYVGTKKQLIRCVNGWADEIVARKHKQENGMGMLAILFGCICRTDSVMCAICRQLFPADQSRLLSGQYDQMDIRPTVCLQHNDQMIKMMYMYENNILCFPGTNRINIKYLHD